MKIALVGIGKIAVDQHIPAITAAKDLTLAATVSRNGQVDGIPAYRNLDKMLSENPDISVVSLCLPPAPRFDYAARALAAGRHVMLEKPPGATLSECRILADMAQNAGVSIFATWHSREAAQVAAAKSWLAGKRLTRLHISWKEDVRRWHPGQQWIWEPGGMGVFDPGINALSIMTEILPDPVYLKSADLDIPANCQTPVAAKLEFKHPGNAKVTADFDFLQTGPQTWSIELTTDQGKAVLSDGGETLYLNGEATPQGPDSELMGEYPRLYAKMAQLVANGQSEMDLAPMRHVSDALSLGRRHIAPEFIE